MSKHIKDEIDVVKYDIRCLEDECDSLHYEIYVCYRRNKLFEYKLTLKELDNSYSELERLEKKYKAELRKESARRELDERLKSSADTLMSQIRCLIELENAKKGEITTEIEQVEETSMGNQLNKDNVTEIEPVEETSMEIQLNEGNVGISDSLTCTKHVSDDEVIPGSLTCTEHVSEDVSDVVDIAGESHLDLVSLVQEKQEITDSIEVEHIDFIIPEYLVQLPSLTDQFAKFFAPTLQLLKNCRIFFLVPSLACMVIALYKTRGRVFSNKGRMMGNTSQDDNKFLCLLLSSFCNIIIDRIN